MVARAGKWGTVRDSTDLWRHCAGDSASLSDGHPAGLYAFAPVSAAGWNVATLCDGGGSNRQVSTHCKLTQGPKGARRNAGVVANYQAKPGATGQSVFWFAQADYDNQALEIGFATGASATVLGSVAVPRLQLETWYALSLSVLDEVGGTYGLHATLESLADASVNAALDLAGRTDYYGVGLWGVATNRAVSRFSTVVIDPA
jgi:hypothetical protein